MTIIPACGSTTPGVGDIDDDVHATADVEYNCPRSLDAELLLRPRQRIRFSEADAPVLVTYRSGGLFMVLKDGRRMRYIDNAEEIDVKYDGAGEVTAIAAGDAGFWIGVRARLLHYSAGSVMVEVVSPGSLPGEVRSIAEGDDHLWVLTTHGRRTVITAFDRAGLFRGEVRIAGRTSLEFDARLHPAEQPDRLLAAAVRAPHQIREYRADLGSFRDLTLIEDSPVNHGNNAIEADLFAMGALPLGCGKILLVLTDLTSSRRQLHIVDTSLKSVIRSSTLSVPLGMVQASPEERMVLGIQDVADGRELLLFGWEWNSQKPLTGELQ